MGLLPGLSSASHISLCLLPPALGTAKSSLNAEALEVVEPLVGILPGRSFCFAFALCPCLGEAPELWKWKSQVDQFVPELFHCLPSSHFTQKTLG